MKHCNNCHRTRLEDGEVVGMAVDSICNCCPKCYPLPQPHHSHLGPQQPIEGNAVDGSSFEIPQSHPEDYTPAITYSPSIQVGKHKVYGIGTGANGEIVVLHTSFDSEDMSQAPTEEG